MTPNDQILPNEKDTFARLITGDHAAFEAIFIHYTKRLFPFILKMTRDESSAEEIMQEVFISIWTKREKFAAVDNYQGYIFQITTNQTINYLRSQARTHIRLNNLARKIVETENSTEEKIDLRQSEAIVKEVIESLPPQRKLIFKLSREQGLSHDQIADQLHISKNTVKNQIMEAMRMIKEQLERKAGTSLALIIFIMKSHSN